MSFVSDSVQPHRQQPTRLPRPWDSPGRNTGVGCYFLLQYVEVKSESEVALSCPTLSDPMDCSPPDSSIHGIFQARVLEWGAIAFSAVSLIPWDKLSNLWTTPQAKLASCFLNIWPILIFPINHISRYDSITNVNATPRKQTRNLVSCTHWSLSGML